MREEGFPESLILQPEVAPKGSLTSGLWPWSGSLEELGWGSGWGGGASAVQYLGQDTPVSYLAKGSVIPPALLPCLPHSEASKGPLNGQQWTHIINSLPRAWTEQTVYPG